MFFSHIILFSVGAELNAQVPTTYSRGATKGRRHQRSHNGSRAGGVQDIHIPRMRFHRGHRVPEPTGKYY